MSLLIGSFIAGMLTFLAPCTFPLIPAYIGFITGDGKLTKLQTIRNGALFVVGFMGVFITLGVFASSLSNLFNPDTRLLISRIAGALILIWGLEMLGVFRHKIFQTTWTPRIKGLKAGTPQSSVLLGVLLGIGWTPCVGPILGTIITFLINKGTVLDGAILMFVFSIGLAIPFLLTAILLAHGRQVLQKVESSTPVIRIISGLFLVFIGILFITNTLEVLGRFIFNTLQFLNYDRILDYL
jgi:cytochrome c-type biogenesis protein